MMKRGNCLSLAHIGVRNQFIFLAGTHIFFCFARILNPLPKSPPALKNLAEGGGGGWGRGILVHFFFHRAQNLLTIFQYRLGGTCMRSTSYPGKNNWRGGGNFAHDIVHTTHLHTTQKKNLTSAKLGGLLRPPSPRLPVSYSYMLAQKILCPIRAVSGYMRVKLSFERSQRTLV